MDARVDGIQGAFFEDIKEGQKAEFTKIVTEQDVEDFARISGDTNPVHLNEEYAQSTMFKGRIAHGVLTAGLISTVFGTILPGPGAIFVAKSMKFKAPVRLGDEVTAVVTVTKKHAERKFVEFETACLVDGKPVLVGDATLMVPSRDA
ncbi:MAG: MaoC family dehydratase [Rhodospirillales bacterium]